MKGYTHITGMMVTIVMVNLSDVSDTLVALSTRAMSVCAVMVAATEAALL
jgi:hypothetical protein